MKTFWLLIFFAFSISCSAQIYNQMAFSANYRYLGRNVLGAGIELRLSDKNVAASNIGAQILYFSDNGKAKFTPEIHLNRVLSDDNIIFAGVSANRYAIEPQLGINLFNLISLNTGYAIPISKEKYFKGFTFGFVINLGSSGFYSSMKLM